MDKKRMLELCELYLDSAQMKLKEAQMFDDVITEPLKDHVLFLQKVSQLINNQNNESSNIPD